MIVLDTNVVSEAMKPEPEPALRAWLNQQEGFLGFSRCSKVAILNNTCTI
jgi:predicted nucleic acid-binding protein